MTRKTSGPWLAFIGQYSTFAELTAATGYPPGVVAYAEDTGLCYGDGTNWHHTESRQLYAAGNTSTAPVPDCSLSLTQAWTQNGSVTWGVPTNTTLCNVGDILSLLVTKDATGTARTTAWNAIYRNAPSIASTSTSGAKASFMYLWDGVSWQYIGGSTAFA